MTDENQFTALVLEEDDDHKVTASVETLDNDRLPEGEVTVAVEYSTLNYKDAMIIQGIGRLVREYPHVPGIDFAGTVEASDSPDYKPGDKVVLTSDGDGLRALLKDGRKIACIVATMGTTDAFGLDDLQTIHAIRDNLVDEFGLDYRPQIHADAVIGWAWSVFNDYDFEENSLGFQHRTVRELAGTTRRIQHLGLADSIGIDFHKTGFTPYISSLFLTSDSADLKRITRADESMPYLFQAGHYHPGKFTLETTRSGSGPMAALANLLLFGRQGLRALLGHLVTLAEVLREPNNPIDIGFNCPRRKVANPQIIDLGLLAAEKAINAACDPPESSGMKARCRAYLSAVAKAKSQLGGVDISGIHLITEVHDRWKGDFLNRKDKGLSQVFKTKEEVWDRLKTVFDRHTQWYLIDMINLRTAYHKPAYSP
ncbi:MAG: alcohol dehydrogenase catalytic domain-containing protein, partial [Proteobacteria bacterium]|nr:alcohol dehydrogenase catalytic domain-containing protein [Pseudomonadota bacterium]